MLDDEYDGTGGFVVDLGSGEDVAVRGAGLGRAGRTSFRGAFVLAASASLSALRLGRGAGIPRSVVPFVRNVWAAGPVAEEVAIGAGDRDCDGACD